MKKHALCTQRIFVVILLAAAMVACAPEVPTTTRRTPVATEPTLFREDAAFTLTTTEDAICLAVASDERLVLGVGRDDDSEASNKVNEHAALVVYRNDGVLLATQPLDAAPHAVAVAHIEAFPPSSLAERFMPQLAERRVPTSDVVVVAMGRRLAFYSLDEIADGEQQTTPLEEWPPLPEKCDITSIAVGMDHIFVGDAGRGCVVALTSDGAIAREWGKRQLPQDAAATGTFAGFVFYAVRRLTVAVSPQTGILHANNPGKHRVEAWTQDGHWEAPLGWGEASTAAHGFCGCCNPIDLAILPNGDFVTAEKGMTRVKVFSSRGVYRGMVADVASFSLAKLRDTRPLRITTTPAGAVIILDASEHRVRRFDPLQ